MANLPGFYSVVFSIAIPIALQNLLQNFVNMLDTIMVGQLGSVEIAAVGLGNQIFFILNMIFFGAASGGSIFISQFWGKGDIVGVKRTTGLMLAISISVSMLFFLGATIFPSTLIGLYSNDEQVIILGAKYLRSVSLVYPIMAVSVPLQFAYRSTGHVKLPMVSTSVSFITNIISNWVLIFGLNLEIGGVIVSTPALGVVGAGIATVISRLVEFLIIVAYSYKKKFEAAGTFHEFFSFDNAFVWRFVKIALPVVINEMLWSLGITLHSSIFAHASTNAIASFNITQTISQLTWTIFMGLGSAAAIVLGRKIGANKEDEAQAYAYRFAWFIPLMAFIISFLLIPLSMLLPYLFNVEADIIYQGKLMLRVLQIFYPANAFNMFFIVGISRSGGDTIFGGVNDLIWMWVVAIPLAAVAAFIWHVEPFMIYACLMSEQIFKAVAGLIRLRSGKWIRHVTE